VENRQLAGYERGLPAAGLVIWHIDAAKAGNTAECYPGAHPAPTYHYKVAVVQADGLLPARKGEQPGDAGDPGRAPRRSGSLRTALDPEQPDCTDGTASGVSVTDITPLGRGGSVRATMTPSQSFVLTVSKAGTGERVR